jgi:hypothetical protein
MEDVLGGDKALLKSGWIASPRSGDARLSLVLQAFQSAN